MKKSKVYSSDAEKLHRQRRKLYDAHLKYQNSFIDKRTGKCKSKFLEERACPVCKCEENIFLFNKAGGTYVKCNSCGMIFLNPVFKDKYLAQFYAGNIDCQAIVHEEEASFYRSIYNSGLDMMDKRKVKGNLLDVGCSGGFFLDIAKKRFWKTYGIEINKSEFKIAIRKDHVFGTQKF